MAQKSAKTSRNHLSHQKIFCYLPRLPAMAAAIAAGRGRREIVSPAILIYALKSQELTKITQWSNLLNCGNIVKAIDAVSREQLLQIASSFGVRNPVPVFGMVPVRSGALLPTITEEDRIILNNVEKVAKFLTAGTANQTVNGDVNVVSLVQELLPVLPSITSKILPDVLSRLSSRVFARVIRESFL